MTIDGHAYEWKFDTAVHTVLGANAVVANFRLAYDADAFYALVHVTDNSPLLNSADVPEELFKRGDAIGLCFGPVAGGGGNQRFLFTQLKGKPVCLALRQTWPEKRPHTFSTDQRRDVTLDYVGLVPEARVAFQVVPGGYIAEIRLPFSILGGAPVDGLQFPFDLQIIQSDAGGSRNVATAWWQTNTGKAMTTTDLPTEAQLYPQTWGEARLSKTDPGPQPQRQPVVDADEETVFKGPGTPISFTAPRDCRVSLIVTDQKGWIERELLRAEKMTKGAHTVYWNGRDRTNSPCPPGKYAYKVAYFDPIKTSFYGSVGNSGRPVYETPDGLGSIGGIWGGPETVAADETGVYMMHGFQEGQKPMRKIDGEGNPVWFAEIEHQRVAACADAGKLYVVCGEGGEGSEENLYVLDAATGGVTRRLSLGKTLIHGMAIVGAKAYLSETAANRLRVIDLDKWTEIAPLPLPAPLGVCRMDVQHLLVCSGTGVLAVDADTGTSRAFVAGLQAPRSVVSDKTGSVFVSDLGTRQQILKYKSDGALLATFGKAGGRGTSAIPYNPMEFRNITGLAIGPGGDLWAVEENESPRRFIHLSADGVWKEDVIGPSGFATVIPDLDDLSRIYYNVEPGSIQYIQAKADYAQYARKPGSPVGAWKIEALHYLSQNGVDLSAKPAMLTYPNGPTASGYHGGYCFTAANGKRYMFIQQYRDSGASLFIADGPRWRPAMVYADPGFSGRIWSDANGDGLVQDAEMYDDTIPSKVWRMWVHIDPDFTLHGIEGVLKPSGVLPSGAPDYRNGKFTPYLSNATHPMSTYLDGTGDMPNAEPLDPDDPSAAYVLAGAGPHRFNAADDWDRYGESRLIKIKNGAAQWIVGHHDSRLLHDGDDMLLNGSAGIVDSVILIPDVLNGFEAYTTDGLALGWAITDEQGKITFTGPNALYFENAAQSQFLKDPVSHKRLLFVTSSEDIRVLEVSGPFDKSITRSEGTITLAKPAQRSRQAPGQYTIAYRTWDAPQYNEPNVDGFDWEWSPDVESLEIADKAGQPVAEVRLRRDAGRLCVIADVLDETPFAHGDAKFGAADGIELLLGSASRTGKNTTQAGDTRIYLSARRAGSTLEGTLLGIRPASAPITVTPFMRVPHRDDEFYNPVPEPTTIDFSKELLPIPGAAAAAKERFDGHGYRIEAEIPLEFLPELTQNRRVRIRRFSTDKSEERLDMPSPTRLNVAVYQDQPTGAAKRLAWKDDGDAGADPRVLTASRWGLANAKVEISWPTPASDSKFHVYRSDGRDPGAATAVGSGWSGTDAYDTSVTQDKYYWLAPVVGGREGQWIGPLRPSDSAVDFWSSQYAPPVALDAKTTLTATAGEYSGTVLSTPPNTTLAVASARGVTATVVPGSNGTWSLVTHAEKDVAAGTVATVVLKATTAGKSTSYNVPVTVSQEPLADLNPGLLVVDGDPRKEPVPASDSPLPEEAPKGADEWKFAPLTTAFARASLGDGAAPELHLHGTVITATHDLQVAPVAGGWTLDFEVKFGPIYNSENPETIQISDADGHTIAELTHARGAGAWEGHRQYFALNGHAFYSSVEVLDAVRGSWQPIHLKIANGRVALTYGAGYSDDQPIVGGNATAPAKLSLKLDGFSIKDLWVRNIRLRAAN